MTNQKKPEPNPIEKAIGDRAKPKNPSMNNLDTMRLPQNPVEIPDEPSPSEMLTLEKLNRRTEERLRDKPVETTVIHTILKAPIIPVSKPDPQPVTKTSSEESPPQKIDEIDKYSDVVKSPALGTPEDQDREAQRQDNAPTVSSVRKMIDEHPEIFKPVEDIEFTALKKYIQEDGFVLSTVAFHIVTLCAQPMVTPSTTTWDFADRASIPDMVLALLNQPGYLEGIWPSLKIVMSSNKGNSAWCAGIATTIAFFDVVRTLPAVKELSNENKV